MLGAGADGPIESYATRAALRRSTLASPLLGRPRPLAPPVSCYQNVLERLLGASSACRIGRMVQASTIWLVVLLPLPRRLHQVNALARFKASRDSGRLR